MESTRGAGQDPPRVVTNIPMPDRTFIVIFTDVKEIVSENQGPFQPLKVYRHISVY